MLISVAEIQEKWDNGLEITDLEFNSHRFHNFSTTKLMFSTLANQKLPQTHRVYNNYLMFNHLVLR
jgi:hypothetical protein